MRKRAESECPSNSRRRDFSCLERWRARKDLASHLTLVIHGTQRDALSWALKS